MHGHPLERLRQGIDVFVSGAFSGQAGGLHLQQPLAFERVGDQGVAAGRGEQRAEHLGVQDVPLLGRRDRGAAAVLDDDHAALLQAADAFTDHAAADVEVLGQRDLAGKHLSRRDLANGD